MYKRSLFTITIFLFSLFVVFRPATSFAKQEDVNSDIPEQDGIYDEPTQKGVKVRVFVHKERQEKPAKTSASVALVCGLTDADSIATVHPAGWKLPSNWYYNLNPGSAPTSVGGTNLATLTGNGFADWTTAVGGKVNFTRSTDTTIARSSYDGKNVIAWGRITASALGITYIRYYPSTGQVVDVDTIMNKRYQWSWANSNSCADPNAYDAEDILTHEQGHWMGMNDEYDTAAYQNATMYGYGSKGEVKKITLTTGDTDGAKAIYP